MTRWSLQWESPFLPLYWNHNFVHCVYSHDLIAKTLSFQEARILVDSSAGYYRFYVDEDEIPLLHDRYLLWARSRGPEQYAHAIRSLRRSVSLLPWECKFSTSPFDSNFPLQESLFHQAVALHLVTQPHLTNSLAAALRCSLQALGHDPTAALEISLPVTLPPVLVEQLEWCRLCLSANISRNTGSALAKHLAKWRYITAGDSHKPLSEASLRERLDRDTQDLTRLEETSLSLQEVRDGTRRRHIDYLIKYALRLPNDVASIAHLIGHLSFWRFITKQIWMKLWYLLEERLAVLEDCTQQPVGHLTREELCTMWPTAIASAAGRGSYLYRRDDRDASLYWNGRDEIEREKEVPAIDFAGIDEVRGDTGYPGSVQGTAVVIGWNDNPFEKASALQTDSILVVPQTTPAFSGLLQRVRGLIVDEGGLTGHASIISREFKIPSIIGTHVGTRVFHDGDLIRLDATSGVAARLGAATDMTILAEAKTDAT
jgi:phosphohistidine swiveling domain-containing protein